MSPVTSRLAGRGRAAPWFTVINHLNTGSQGEGESQDSAKLFTNPTDPLDIDGSGQVNVADVDLVMQELARSGSRKLDPVLDRPLAPPFFDTNGDGRVSPLDALVIVNNLNARNANRTDALAVDGATADSLDASLDSLFGQGEEGLFDV